jgi:hypothetical protein
MLATAFLRAFSFLEKSTFPDKHVILSDEEILARFYETEEVLSFEDGNAWVTLNAEAHVGAKVADDVKPPRHREPIVTAGKTLNAKLIEKLRESNVEKIPLRAEALVGRAHDARERDGRVLVQHFLDLLAGQTMSLDADVPVVAVPAAGTGGKLPTARDLGEADGKLLCDRVGTDNLGVPRTPLHGLGVHLLSSPRSM